MPTVHNKERQFDSRPVVRVLKSDREARSSKLISSGIERCAVLHFISLHQLAAPANPKIGLDGVSKRRPILDAMRAGETNLL
jgi:hypothetical protein